MENKRSLVNFAGLLVTFVLVAMSQTAHGVERISYYHNDHLGSPVVATNPQGAVVWRESYQPYGTREHQGGNQNSLWFTGKQEEASFGVSYFGARWYDPEMGRFLAMDPVEISPGDPHSFNRYTYANNNPYRFVDPDGRESLEEIGGYLSDGKIRRRGIDGVQRWVTPCPGYIDYDDPGIYYGLFTSIALAFQGPATSLARGSAGPRMQSNLFRVVDDIELADIHKQGIFRTASGQFEGKQFVDNIEDAKELQKRFIEFFGGNQTVVGAHAPQSVMKNATRTPFSDIPNGVAITVPKSDLSLITPELK